jgi:hypothetical protein
MPYIIIKYRFKAGAPFSASDVKISLKNNIRQRKVNENNLFTVDNNIYLRSKINYRNRAEELEMSYLKQSRNLKLFQSDKRFDIYLYYPITDNSNNIKEEYMVNYNDFCYFRAEVDAYGLKGLNHLNFYSQKFNFKNNFPEEIVCVGV